MSAQNFNPETFYKKSSYPINKTGEPDATNKTPGQGQYKMESKFNSTVYVVEGLEIAEMSYREYLETYWNDETTTPEGVANRTQVRAIILDSDGELAAKSKNAGELNPYCYTEDEEVDNDGDVIKGAYMPKIQWGTFTWSGAHGSGPLKWNRDIYDTEAEACDEILRGFESDYWTVSRNVPSCYDTMDDALAAIADNGIM